MIELKRTTSENEGFRLLISYLDKELRSNYNTLQNVYDQFNKIENNQNVVIAYNDEIPVGCGCFKKFDDHSVEIKRMFVKPGYRGQKIGASMLNELEKWAKELNNTSTVLETGPKQLEAIRLYQKSGYIVVENYGPYKDLPDSLCMKKVLV